MKYFLLVTISMLGLASCDAADTSAHQSTLLFASGFEKDVYIDKTLVPDSEDYDYIRGTDQTTGFHWPIDILGASGSGLHRVDDDHRTALRAEIQTVTGYDGKPTRAMYNEETHREPNKSTQLTYEVLNITQGRSDLYVKYRMKIDSNMLGIHDKWRALFEYKTKDYQDPGQGGTGYRLIAFVYTDKDGKASWHFQGDKDSEHPLWECDTLHPTPQCHNSSVPVIMDAWFTTEYYCTTALKTIVLITQNDSYDTKPPSQPSPSW